jgi:PTS system nitrogen regulatory IIA component
MFPEQFLSIERIDCQGQSYSKKRVLQRIGEMLAPVCEGMGGDDVFDALLERERLGATGLGHGIGLPHARLGGVSEARAALLILRQAVDYDAADQEPVDLIFGLVVPDSAEQRHLDILAALAEMFSDEGMRDQLRICSEPSKVLANFNRWAADREGEE